MKKLLKSVVLVLAVAFLAIQVVRPERTNPPVDASRTMHSQLQPPPEVASILERSCVDCHSHQTRWPWYSYVAPTSWWLAGHVKEAREHMNLSEWAKYERKDADELLEEICEETSKGAMPLSSYLLIHRSSKLSPQDVRTLCEWSKAARERLAMEQR
jgi:hypothetical protein